MWFDYNDVKKNEQSETTHYAIYKNGERIRWGISSVSFKMDITKVEYKNNSLHITGEFEGTFKSSATPEGQIAQIEEGKFEVIL